MLSSSQSHAAIAAVWVRVNTASSLSALTAVISAADGGWSRGSPGCGGDASADFYPVMLIVACLLTLAYIPVCLHCLVDKSFQFNQTV